MINSKEGKSIGSNNKDILRIKIGPSPEKVFDEGDSLDVYAITHSFYWKSDLYKKDDYEPVAVSKNDNCCLTRLHYHGIVIWKGLIKRKGRPVVYFRKGFHTPVVCTRRSYISYVKPTDVLDRLVLTGYLVPKVKSMWARRERRYDTTGYSEKVVNEDVPEDSRFTWNHISYWLLVSSTSKVENLTVSKRLKESLLHLKNSV